MKRESAGAGLSAVFVDYDNIYLSLKRKSEEAAKRFAKESAHWLKEIETGRLITPTNSQDTVPRRRLVMNRCYGNPVPRRNTADNSTDMNSFPFVRHHFLRSGFEVIDCPPLTAQLKNSSDIRIVMDVRDFLTHETYFDEFIILSGDADFTPLLHRLRAHARRTVIFANDYTAAPYTAISDGEVREADLIAALLEQRAPAEIAAPEAKPQIADAGRRDTIRAEIIAEVVAAVRASTHPVPLEALADRAVRALGHERTIGSSWGGSGGFRDLLASSLPPAIRMSDNPPYVCYEVSRVQAAEAPQPAVAPAPARQPAPSRFPLSGIGQPTPAAPLPTTAPAPAALQPIVAPLQPRRPAPPEPESIPRAEDTFPPPRASAPRPEPRIEPTTVPAPEPRRDVATAIQQSIARIQEACQAPPLSPPEYRRLFEIMAQEITDNQLSGAQTVTSIVAKAHEVGIDVRRDDVRFILEVVSEADPWFEQGASANLFAGRFRNFVVGRCRSQGLNLSADELDLVEAWFAGSGKEPVTTGVSIRPAAAPIAAATPPARPALQPERSWTLEEGRQHIAEQRYQTSQIRTPAAPSPAPATEPVEYRGDDMPRIVRTRLRG